MPRKTPKTARHIEVERKFDVGESTVSPSFEGIAAVARVEQSPPQELDAWYFDTPSRDLSRNRITLRRRTGGADAGWHVKLPAGPDSRTEIRAPLGSSTGNTADALPEDLRDVVLAIVRDRPLELVARITTHRETQILYSVEGTALAEFCKDQVTAWSAESADSSGAGPAAQKWREWELELRAPDRAGGTEDPALLNRLAHRLLDAGAVPAGHGSKLARALGSTESPEDAKRPSDPVHRAVAEHVDDLLLWDRAVRADAYDAVHQMRVTIRKIRSLLKDGQESFGVPETAWIIDELRELAGILGVARDAEVLGERYERELDRLATELVRGPVRERLVGGARRRYRTGLRRSLVAMRSARYFRLLDSLDALVSAGPKISRGQGTTPVNIDAAYKRVRKAAKAAHTLNAEPAEHDPESASAAENHRNEALHLIRKRAKRLRYTAAATGANRVAQEAKAIQTLLGDHQDSVVSREHLIQQSETAHAASEDTFTYGLLYQQESDLADSCRAQLDDALRRLQKAVRKARR